MAGSIFSSAGTMVSDAVRRIRMYFWPSKASLTMSMICGTVYLVFFRPMKVKVPVGLKLLTKGRPVRSLTHSRTWFQGLSRISKA